MLMPYFLQMCETILTIMLNYTTVKLEIVTNVTNFTFLQQDQGRFDLGKYTQYLPVL